MPPRFLDGYDKPYALPVERAISLDQSGISNAQIAMRPLDLEHLETLLEVEDASVLPPIEVVLVESGFIVIDGYHRLERARRKGEERILCMARTYTSVRDIIHAAFRANLSHGLPARQPTRTAYALWLYMTPDEKGNTLSLRRAAQMAGISHVALIKAVNKMEEKATRELEEQQETKTPPTNTNKQMHRVVQHLDKMIVAIASLERMQQREQNAAAFEPREDYTHHLVTHFHGKEHPEQTAHLLQQIGQSLLRASSHLLQHQEAEG